MNTETLWIGGFCAVVVALFAALIVATVDEREQWEAFKVAHQCKVVAHIRGDVFNTVGIGGDGKIAVGIGSAPDKTGWLCDNGITYYK